MLCSSEFSNLLFSHSSRIRDTKVLRVQVTVPCLLWSQESPFLNCFQFFDFPHSFCQSFSRLKALSVSWVSALSFCSSRLPGQISVVTYSPRFLLLLWQFLQTAFIWALFYFFSLGFAFLLNTVLSSKQLKKIFFWPLNSFQYQYLFKEVSLLLLMYPVLMVQKLFTHPGMRFPWSLVLSNTRSCEGLLYLLCS